MRIKEIESEQFAGINDCEVELENGLNLIIGENESGKSTLVDLLYHMFFKDVAIDGRSDSDFVNQYFPKNAQGYQPDEIEGEVKFKTEAGTYKLNKTWSKKGKTGSSCKLKLPDKTIISDMDAINGILSGILVYGKGVYDELIFASQRREQTVLKGLLAGKDQKKGQEKTLNSVRDLASTLTRAVMETGGIEIDRAEAELRAKLDAFSGNWDFDKDLPKDGLKRGINNRWKQNVGEILKAYYAKEEIASERDKAISAEKKVEETNQRLRQKKEDLARAKTIRESFIKCRSLIKTQHLNESLLEQAKKDLETMMNASTDWPVKRAQSETARKLRTALRNAEKQAHYDQVKALEDKLTDTLRQADEAGTVDEEEVKEAVTRERNVTELESKLKGMNLSARVKKLGDAEIQIRSAVSGAPLGTDGEAVDITEAVVISVPGVADIELAPKGVDAEAIQQKLKLNRDRLREIFAKHDVASADMLKEKQGRIKKLAESLTELAQRIEGALNGISWEVLCEQADQLPEDTRSVSEIQEEITRFCGNDSIDTCIGRIDAYIDSYIKAYETPDKLNEMIGGKKNDIKNLKHNVDSAEDIPEEFKGIDDPDKYDETLQARIEAEDGETDTLRDSLSKAEKNLPEKSAEEYAEELKQAEKVFADTKEEYARWKHILEVFLNVKNAQQGNPMADVEKAFAGNLTLLSGGNLVLTSIDEKLSSTITSGKNILSADILSDGTKDTISLAFRLAVLEHLYPDGGCVAVFDDPFTDMDPKRTKKACGLIQKFAEKNQVIFVTCDEKYKDLLSGNVVEMKKEEND